MSQENVLDNLKKSESWIRGIYLLIFLFILQIMEIVIVVLTVFQFVASIFTGGRLPSLDAFSRGLANYTRNILLYITYQSDLKPFPFREWREETISHEVL